MTLQIVEPNSRKTNHLTAGRKNKPNGILTNKNAANSSNHVKGFDEKQVKNEKKHDGMYFISLYSNIVYK